jgi:Zn-dependent protease with chaperone function
MPTSLLRRAMLAWLCALASVATLTLASPAHGLSSARKARLDAFDQRVASELEALDPKAAATFAEANAARDRGELDVAASKFEDVHRAVPKFSHALRRLCGVELRLGRHDAAITHCRGALEIEPTSENLSALALALLWAPPGENAPLADVSEAQQHASHALALDPDDDFAAAALGQAALATNDLAALRRASERLVALAPDEPTGHFFAALADASDQRWSDAEHEVEVARSLGLPAEEADRLHAAIRSSEPLHLRAIGPASYLLGGWLAALALLFLAGVVLSRATLRAAAALPRERTGHAHGSSAAIRKAYRVVLWIACAFYYVSIPLVLAVVLGLGGGLVLLFLTIGHVPIKLFVIVLGVAGVTTWGVLKSLFVRGKDTPPGTKLDLDEHPNLRATLDEVAERIGTRPVDSVYMTPTVELAVTERGGAWARLRGRRTERCLIVGAGVLEGMRLDELRAVLAHEYGHFQNEDTAGGGFALQVRRSMLTTALHLARGGVATWYNPAWWFVRGFFAMFLRISQGASRLQEVLADRWAAFAYGSEAFERGLRHVIVRSVRFEAHANATIKEALAADAPLANLYASTPTEPPSEDDLDCAAREALEAKPSPYDSHPAPSTRIALVRALDAEPETIAADADEPAWSLFSDRAAIEEQMTGEIRDRIPGLRAPPPKKKKPKAKAPAAEATDDVPA